MGALEIEKLSVEKAPEEKAPEESQTFGQWLNETFVEDKWFWLIIVVLLLANIGIYQSLFLGGWVGFILSAYSAIANDSI